MENMENGNKSSFVWIIVSAILAIILVIVLVSGGETSAPAVTDSGTPVVETSATPVTEVVKTTTEAPKTVTPPATKTTTAAPKTTTAPKKTSTGAFILSYTSKGFSPYQLNLVRGQSIHVVNNASASLRISPADKINQPYASFSQSKTVGTGGTFDYTFVTPGVYGYYNLSNPTHQGIIVVQ